MTRLLRLAIALDQVANVLAGGHPDDHCRAAYESEHLRRHLPPEYRAP